MPPKKKERGVVYQNPEETNIDIIINGEPFVPKYPKNVPMSSRDENPVVYLEISASGGSKQIDGLLSLPRVIGRLYFELRTDLVPLASSNFLNLVMGAGVNIRDSVKYHYKGTKIHRVVKDKLFQAGDLLGEQGHCSRSSYNNGSLFVDENFLLRHTGPGCLSMCNRGPNTNGSLFQVTFTAQETLDEKCVVFGCLSTDESFKVLEEISYFGTKWGAPKEELTITDCDQVFPIKK